MRYSDDHKQSVRLKIVEAASHALRRDGIDGVGIPALMKKAGLTHGGFYAHFRDRDELVCEAIRFAGEATAADVLQAEGGIEGVLRTYLSNEHALHPENGCVLAALGMEGARQGKSVRAAFGELARGFVRHIHNRIRPATGRARLSDGAIELSSRMIGAVVLARLVDDPALADRILTVARSATLHPDRS